MNTEREMKEWLDGWFFAIDHERNCTTSTPVDRDFIPSHRPKYVYAEDGPVSNNNSHHWSETEDAIMLEMRRAGNTFREIGKALSLAGSTCQRRFKELLEVQGFTPPKRKHKPLKWSLETEARVVAMREMGMGFHEIGPVCGMTRQQANELYRRYKDRQKREEMAA